MSTVSIGLRGWRFDEETVFDAEGNFRPLDELPEAEREMLVRLVALYDAPCDACWLEHGDAGLEECNRADVVYGEPMAEITVCAEHEADLLYWFREVGGTEHRGTERFQEAFHEWYAAGHRAPAGYGGLEHVETDPDAVPDPDVPDDGIVTVERDPEERTRIDLHDPELLAEVFGEERAAEILAQLPDAGSEAAGDGEGDGDGEGASEDEDDGPGGELDMDGLDLDVDYST